MLESCQHPAPLQGLGNDKSKLNFLVDLASAISDPYYVKMKQESNKDKNAWQSV